ncbi:TipAS antibiotic-recognition domain-containing protein [Candidatus Dojkabacteria bacterium]|nr:TipAS antibiotic-recognition domain-containing protein [Candidatus Dojkabacteria bacterium]
MNILDEYKEKEELDPVEHQEKYQEETFNRFGYSDAYKESHERTSKYSKEELKEILERGSKILKKLSELMDREPSDPEVQALVQEWRDYISDSFYNCTLEILRGLGQGYVMDVRFTKNIDKVKVGLSPFFSEAIEYYCNSRG